MKQTPRKKPKLKPCKMCATEFLQYDSLTVWCSPHCGYELAKLRTEQSYVKETKRLRSDWRGNNRPYQMRKAQDDCNSYIRGRDKGEGCVSCDKPPLWTGQWHASHYRPAGNCSSLRFHPMNIHKACSECNNFKSGNLVEFRIGLINKIGLKNVEWLESQNQTYTWTLEDIKDIRIHYKESLNYLPIVV